MIKKTGYIGTVLVVSLGLSLVTGSATAEDIIASRTGNVVTWEILPGFVHPTRILWTNGIADTHRRSDPRFSLKPVDGKVYENGGIEEPVVVDNLFRLRF